MRNLIALFALAAAALAQTSSSGAGGATGTGSQPPPASTPGSANAARTSPATTSQDFTGAVANDLLFRLADGMESRNPRLTLGVFDPARLSDYGRFSAQVNAWLRDHSSFRVYYKVRQTSVEDGRGIALVDFAYEAQPVTEGATPVRRHEQLRFAFERGRRGWKIVDVSPRAFFS